jgi:hypothetical protein
MPHDCAGPAVFNVTMFGISQVVPAIRSSAPEFLVAGLPALRVGHGRSSRFARRATGKSHPGVLPDESSLSGKNIPLSEWQKL